MKIGLILTNDWELFGNGSGDYYELQHNPLKDLLILLSEYNAKITIMAETAQQLAMQANSRYIPYFKDIVKSWETILQNVVIQGSDVQLHLHPQWFGAEYTNDTWQLNMDKSALSSLPEEEILSAIKHSKKYLESILKLVAPYYECIAFRAGGYCIQPEEAAIYALKKAGIRCDTSVTKGLVNTGFYNFKDAYSNIIPWYTSSELLTQKGSPESGLLELPIYSISKISSNVLRKFLPSLYYQLFYSVGVSSRELAWAKNRDKIKEQRYPRQERYYKKNEKKSMNFYINSILSNQTIQLDYDYLPASVFVNILKQIYKKYNTSKYNSMFPGIIPVVASGHIKDMHNSDNIRMILELISNELATEIDYITISEFINNYMD